MKNIALFLALCFTMNVFASVGPIQKFEKSLDSYNYTLSVEWDQKDEAFKKEATKKFLSEIKSLIENENLNKEDVIFLLEKKVNNKETIEAIKLRTSLLGDIRTSNEFAETIMNSSEDFYSRGASWNGTVKVVAISALVLTVALGFAMWYSATHGCQEYAQICDNHGCHNDYNNCQQHGYVGPHL